MSSRPLTAETFISGHFKMTHANGRWSFSGICGKRGLSATRLFTAASVAEDEHGLGLAPWTIVGCGSSKVSKG